jgi:hypothetical protein
MPCMSCTKPPPRGSYGEWSQQYELQYGMLLQGGVLIAHYQGSVKVVVGNLLAAQQNLRTKWAHKQCG